MTRILVTGGAGFVGSCVAEKLLLDKDNFVVILDDLSTGSIGKLPTEAKDRWRFVKADVNTYSEIAEVMLGSRFDYVFHYAALVGVKRTQDNPVKVLKDIDGIKNVLNLSKSTGVKIVMCIGKGWTKVRFVVCSLEQQSHHIISYRGIRSSHGRVEHQQ